MSPLFFDIMFQKGGDVISLMGDKVVAGIKGFDFNPKFQESKRYKV